MKKKYFLVLIAPILILFAVSSIYIERKLEGWMAERTQTELSREAATIAGVFGVAPIEMEIATLDPFIDKLARDSHFRMTIIRDDGTVIADSWMATHEIGDMKNHADRPEVRMARTDSFGASIRYSNTVKTEMYYLAIPLIMPDFSGFIRVAISLGATQTYLSELHQLLFQAGLVGLMLLIVIVLVAARYIDQVNAEHSRELERNVESRTKDIKLIQTLGQMLAGCESIDEICEVVCSAAPTIFQGASGAISLSPSSLDPIEVIARWGDDWHPKQSYAFNDCWAFRRGTHHLSDKETLGFNCKHFVSEGPVLCVPIMSQGISLGAIHVMSEEEEISERLQEMALTIAEHLSLSMANVNLRESLKNQAIRDPLTNLHNRRYLDEALPRDISRAERSKKPLGVMMIDVDHFKRFNDTFGHDAGDFVLQQLGAELSESVRGQDIACRYGGEEFTIIMPETDIAAMTSRANELLARVRSKKLSYKNKVLGHITLSIGISVYPTHGKDSQTLISVADKALYAAKNAGRDCVEVAVISNDLAADSAGSFVDNPWSDREKKSA